MLRDSAVGAAARIRRRLGLGCIVVCAAAAVVTAAAPADQRTTSNPEELWRAYPLEQTPTGAGGAPPSTSAGRQGAGGGASSPTGYEPGSSWIVLLAVAAGGALLMFMAIRLAAVWLHRGQVWAPGGARTGSNDEVPVPQLPRDRLWAGAGGAPAQPPHPADRGSRVTPIVDFSATVRNAPVCQIRWSRQSACFYAVTTDADGVEQRFARSPSFDWRGPSPPEQSPEAQAALRRLAKELRDRGWRPLRAKGIDFDERQWYARRFRRPTEAEAAEKPRESDGRAGPTGRAGRAQRGSRARS